MCLSAEQSRAEQKVEQSRAGGSRIEQEQSGAEHEHHRERAEKSRAEKRRAKGFPI
jgi:hypothetical protein